MQLISKQSFIGLIGSFFLWAAGPSLSTGFVFDQLMVAQDEPRSGQASRDSDICPQDLSSLSPEMEEILQFIDAPQFKRAIRSSLHASIPKAIQRADGLKAEIAHLRQEIKQQKLTQRESEKIARQSSDNSSDVLRPCSKGEKGSYCSAVERYYMARASNLANQAFLEALLCYDRRVLPK